MQAILGIALPLTATQKGVSTKMANKFDIALCKSAKPKNQCDIVHWGSSEYGIIYASILSVGIHLLWLRSGFKN